MFNANGALPEALATGNNPEKNRMFKREAARDNLAISETQQAVDACLVMLLKQFAPDSDNHADVQEALTHLREGNFMYAATVLLALHDRELLPSDLATLLFAAQETHENM